MNPRSDTPIETEIKIPVPELDPVRRSLLASGAIPFSEKHEERNILFDDESATLASSGCALRLRTACGKSLVTFKGRPSRDGPLRSREELETEVESAGVLERILGALRLFPRFRYEKRREEFRLGSCLVALDETPIGNFVEVEGLPDQIRRTLSILSLEAGDAVLESYPSLYARRRQSNPQLPPDMLFGP